MIHPPHVANPAKQREQRKGNGMFTSKDSVDQHMEPLSVTVQPGGDTHALLGTYIEGKQPKGFAVEIEPQAVPEKSVVVNVTREKSLAEDRFILHVSNKNDIPIAATASWI